ncbi:MAG: hypothetical protein VB878_04455 [Pirellulaceae bacterium]
MNHWVEVSFDCLPLRSISRLDIPIDASPGFRRRCEAIKSSMDRHGTHNSYYLYDVVCVFHLTNRADLGMLEFRCSGTLLTNADDTAAETVDLQVELHSETCNWLTEPVVKWFEATVHQAVLVEFNRYIEAGDLEKTKQRVQHVQKQLEESGGFLGMYL